MKNESIDLTIQNEFLAKLKNVITLLDEIDDVIDELPTKQGNVDSLLSDYLHMFENYDLSKDAVYEISKRIHSERVLRRNLTNMSFIAKTYRDNVNKLMNKQSRVFLHQKIEETMKRLNMEYKNRVITDEDMNELINAEDKTIIPLVHEKIRHRRKRITEDERNEIIERLKNGEIYRTIAEDFNTTVANISVIKKRYLGVDE